MTTGQDQPVPFSCPRCGGPMYKPAGSSFYWHATNNHPRCDITNIADVPKSISVTDEPQDELLRGQPPKKKS
jgi:hypothetical protein